MPRLRIRYKIDCSIIRGEYVIFVFLKKIVLYGEIQTFSDLASNGIFMVVTLFPYTRVRVMDQAVCQIISLQLILCKGMCVQ